MRLEKETFGPVLRSARERRGISLEQMALETKVSVDLWAEMEDNNLTSWPTRIYARSFIRDYAVRVGMDGDEVVNEFCRLFPEWGDRRAEKLRGQSFATTGDLIWEDLPGHPGRRASDQSSANAPTFFGRHKSRIIAVAIDLVAVAALTFVGTLMHFAAWPSAAFSAVGYSAAATLLSNRGFGVAASAAILRAMSTMTTTRALVSSRASNA